jgi:hypothetical protein
VLWSLSSLDRVQACGRNRLPGRERELRVGVRDEDGGKVAHFTAAMLCGSVWACPVCSAKVNAARAEEIGAGIGSWVEAGNFAAMVTLTLAHGRDDPLEDTFQAMVQAFSAITTGRAWLREKAACQVVGWLRATEVTYGRSGWHPHAHVLVLFEGCPHPVDYARMVDRWRRRWQKAAEQQGFGASTEHGVRFDVVTTGEEAGRYICKLQDGRGVGAEVARGDLKAGRLGNVTPLELLDYFERTGDADAADLWAEWENATHGRRALTWSYGLRRRLLAGQPERSDEELAEESASGEVIAVIPDEAWRVMCGHKGLLVAVLRAAEDGGFEAVQALLTRYHVSVTRPNRPPPPEWDSGITRRRSFGGWPGLDRERGAP